MIKQLCLKLIRYRGQWVVLGRNQAVKMLLERVEPQGWPMHSHPQYLGGVVSPIFASSSHFHRIEAPNCAVCSGSDRL